MRYNYQLHEPFLKKKPEEPVTIKVPPMRWPGHVVLMDDTDIAYLNYSCPVNPIVSDKQGHRNYDNWTV
jgi:hypothetical protein